VRGGVGWTTGSALYVFCSGFSIFREQPVAVKALEATPHPDDTGTILAVDRTRLAYDRTLMSWTRTATSLITFGFSIYKFFQIEAERMASDKARVIGPREFALMMIAIGLSSLLLATVQHRRDLHLLRAQFPDARIPRSTATLMAALISVLGTIAFIAAAFRQ
jgi:putative membrane protein